jgi:chromosome partitioning protein
MAIRLCVTSQKGGVGKTTVSLNLAVALAQRGHSTLLADLDPQGGIGHALARADTELRGLADLLVRKATLQQAILQTTIPRLSLLPRGRLDPVQAPAFEKALGRGLLAHVLGKAEDGFDMVLFDTPAGLGPVTRAALGLSTYALVPTQTEALALRSVGQVLRVVDHVRSGENPSLRLLGILPNMVERRIGGSGPGLADLPTGLAGVLRTVIPRASALSEASQRGIPVALLGRPLRTEAYWFELLAAELELLMEGFSGQPLHREEQPQGSAP